MVALWLGLLGGTAALVLPELDVGDSGGSFEADSPTTTAIAADPLTEGAVEAAFVTAFGAGVAGADRAAAVENGADLAGLLDAVAGSPDVTVEAVTLVAPDVADVRVDLGNGMQFASAVRIDGRWFVSRATACGVYSLSGVTCPG